MFSDDRFMTLATGLVLAIVVGTLAQQSDSLMAFFTGEEQGIGEDDQYTVRAGRDQSLDVLGNDSLDGDIVIVTGPSCGVAQPNAAGTIDFVNSASCTGKVAFNYCVDFEGECVESEVTLTVISDENIAPADEAPIVVAVVDNAEDVALAEQMAEQDTGGFANSTVVAETVEPGVVNSVDTQTATTTQGDRLTAGQILLQDEDEGTSGVRFGAAAPSLFTPNTQELITPQETVDVLRQSVAAIQPAQVDTDQGFQTQTSTSRPTSTSLSAGGLQVPLGTEAAPTIAFSAPAQPRLGGASSAPMMLQPPVAGGGTDMALVIDHGPEVHTTSPESIDIASDSTASEPVSVSDEVDALIIAAELEADALFEQTSPSTDRSDIVETETANAGDVSVNTTDPADSSDIVVEMAAQVLLPSPQLVQTVDQSEQLSPEAEALLSDELFKADLEVSSPPASGVEIASLPPATSDTNVDLGNGAIASCGVDVNSAARPGAAISLFISSPCRANQIVTLEHAGLVFTAITDARGTFSTVIPAFVSAATVNVSFDDGASAQARLVVRDADDIRRVAVVWAAPVSIDLHAYEGGERGQEIAHVWVENPRRYRDTLTGGGGYLETFGDVRIVGGTMAEVYSLPTNRLRTQNTVRMDLRVTDATQYCEQNMILRTVQSAQNTQVAKREFNLRMPTCGAAAQAGLVLENFVDAISVVNR